MQPCPSSSSPSLGSNHSVLNGTVPLPYGTVQYQSGNLSGGPVDPQATVTAENGRSERSRQAIIKAATEVFLQHGYLGATTDDVAARASVSKQTLYKHFGGK